MAPRKAKPSTPDGNTDSDSDGHVGVPIPKQLPRIVDSLDRIKSKRSKIRKGIEGDFSTSVAELKTRIVKHYQTEEAKRSETRRKQLDRLSEAIEKKAACEDAMIDLISSLAEEGATIAALMDSVHTGRQSAITAISDGKR